MFTDGRGYSLIELLWVTFLGTLLVGGLLSAVHQAQTWTSNLGLLVESEENAALVPLVLSSFVTSAGNNRFAGSWEGFSITGDEVSLLSDISGPDGRPDESLTDPFERVHLRAKEGNLQLRSGDGSFQPILVGVSAFSADRPSQSLSLFEVESATSRELLATRKTVTTRIQLLLALPNYRPNLFAEVDE